MKSMQKDLDHMRHHHKSLKKQLKGMNIFIQSMNGDKEMTIPMKMAQ